jgi:hypothetical protein
MGRFGKHGYLGDYGTIGNIDGAKPKHLYLQLDHEIDGGEGFVLTDW